MTTKNQATACESDPGTAAAPRGRKTLRSTLFLAGIMGALFAASCGPSAQDYDIPATEYKAPARGGISAGDVLRFTFAGAEQYNQTLKVQPDGRVGLPLVGSVSVAGRSPSTVQGILTSMYEPHLTDPTVFVTIDQPAAAAYVSGAVNTPGKVPLDRQMTVLEAVMEVGGFSKLANPKKVYVIRNEGGKQRRYLLNLKEPLQGNESQAFYLRPYDVIYVEQSNW